MSFTRDRLIGVGAVLVLILLGAVLPYLTMTYLNTASEPVTGTERLIGAGTLIGGIDPTYLPGYVIDNRSAYTLGLNTLSAGLGLQQIGSLVVAATLIGQFFDEINKFFWWPCHLASYLLVLVPIPVLVGAAQLRAQTVPIEIGIAWVPAVLAGIATMVMTFRSYRRIDSYGGF